MSHTIRVLPHLIKHTPRSPVLNQSLAHVFAFDLDHTLIQPKSGSTFSKTATDWEFIKHGNRSTLDVLMKLIKDEPNSLIVIFSNQGGVVSSPPTCKSCIKYITEIELILSHIAAIDNGDSLLNRLWIYASTKMPARTSDSAIFNNMRKPTTGMMRQFRKDVGPTPIVLVYYCGDAAGRPGDFSDSDLMFAHNLYITFRLPEEVFIT